MTDLSEGPIRVRGKTDPVRWNLELQRVRSAIIGYTFAVACVAIALGLALPLQHYQFRDVEVPLLTLAIAITTWYAGNGPAVVAILLSAVCFDYFFTEPLYSLEISTRDLPYFFIFTLWGLIIAVFSAVRRRIEDSLRQAQEALADRAVQQVKSDERLKMVPVVVLTSSHEETDMLRSYKFGVNAYVVKPVDFHEFVNAVKELGAFWAVINEPPPGSMKKVL
jgi:K+-sensing histidine kinase KdpD